ncbi:hypothetical protein GCM10023339_30820 [Alloalcanivorax gelatiniphagus]
MTSTTIRRTLTRSLAVAVALAGLTAGTLGATAATASPHEVDTQSLRSGGDDDGPGDDDGGRSGSSDDDSDDSSSGSGGDDDDRVIRTGDCSGSADWKLKVKTDDGRLEVEGEIDSNVAGQRWAWTLRHNGSVSDRGVGTTTARSGSFEVERKVVDLAGTDSLAFRAVRDGQVCRGVVNY